MTLETRVYESESMTLDMYESMVQSGSVYLRAPKLPNVPTAEEACAYHTMLECRKRELEEVQAHMQRKHAAVTAKPARRR